MALVSKVDASWLQLAAFFDEHLAWAVHEDFRYFLILYEIINGTESEHFPQAVRDDRLLIGRVQRRRVLTHQLFQHQAKFQASFRLAGWSQPASSESREQLLLELVFLSLVPDVVVGQSRRKNVRVVAW